jgi:ArsR family transcriptional regulator
MSKQDLRAAQKIFRALADRNRLRILLMLRGRPLAVCEIREVLGIAVSTVSKHLSLLREAGLITDEKDGKWVNYRLSEAGAPGAEPLLDLLEKLSRDDPLVRSDRKRSQAADRFRICRKLKIQGSNPKGEV